jgi:hypothetical protein
MDNRLLSAPPDSCGDFGDAVIRRCDEHEVALIGERLRRRHYAASRYRAGEMHSLFGFHVSAGNNLISTLSQPDSKGAAYLAHTDKPVAGRHRVPHLARCSHMVCLVRLAVNGREPTRIAAAASVR